MKKKFNIVYKTTNRVNGKYYHGCHRTDVLDDGYLGSGTLFQKALAKYGKEAFEREILGFYDTKEAMIAAEKEVVNHTDPMSYNLIPGGAGLFEHTPDTHEKMSKGQTGRVVTEVQKEKIRKSLTGRKSTPETRKRISDGLKRRGYKMTPSHRAALREVNLGRPMREDTKQKIGDANRGNTMSVETRKRVSDSNKTRVVTPETRKKMSDLHKGKFVSSETCNKISIACKQHYAFRALDRYENLFTRVSC